MSRGYRRCICAAQSDQGLCCYCCPLKDTVEYFHAQSGPWSSFTIHIWNKGPLCNVETLKIMLSTLYKIFSKRNIDWNIFLFFPRKQALTSIQTVSTGDNFTKCQKLFSGKNKKNIINVSSAEWTQRVVKVNHFYILHIWVLVLYEKNEGLRLSIVFTLYSWTQRPV